MVCNSCNGGGTAVPIEAKVHIERRKKFNDSYHSSQSHSQMQHTCKQCGRKHCQHHSAVR